MSSAPPEPAIHVLLVEDHAMLRGLLERTLTAEGFRVTVAETGDDAAALIEAGAMPNIMLSDLRMPGKLNGLDLARWLKQRNPSIAILLMTAFANVHTGEFQVLSKPFDPAMLVTAIREGVSSAGKGASS
jgi:CheY-like chemotaxis protein